MLWGTQRRQAKLARGRGRPGAVRRRDLRLFRCEQPVDAVAGRRRAEPRERLARAGAAQGPGHDAGARPTRAPRSACARACWYRSSPSSFWARRRREVCFDRVVADAGRPRVVHETPATARAVAAGSAPAGDAEAPAGPRRDRGSSRSAASSATSQALRISLIGSLPQLRRFVPARRRRVRARRRLRRLRQGDCRVRNLAERVRLEVAVPRSPPSRSRWSVAAARSPRRTARCTRRWCGWSRPPARPRRPEDFFRELFDTYQLQVEQKAISHVARSTLVRADGRSTALSPAR